MLQANAKRAAMCDAATTLLLLDSLAAGSTRQAAAAADAAVELQGVEQAQELAWQLCEALGSANALAERRARFVQVRMLAEVQQERRT